MLTKKEIANLQLLINYALDVNDLCPKSALNNSQLTLVNRIKERLISIFIRDKYKLYTLGPLREKDYLLIDKTKKIFYKGLANDQRKNTGS